MAEVEDDATRWKEVLRKMLPAGAPLPEDDDELDYSIAIEYEGPTLPYPLPKVDPIDKAPDSKLVTNNTCFRVSNLDTHTISSVDPPKISPNGATKKISRFNRRAVSLGFKRADYGVGEERGGNDSELPRDPTGRTNLMTFGKEEEGVVVNLGFNEPSNGDVEERDEKDTDLAGRVNVVTFEKEEGGDLDLSSQRSSNLSSADNATPVAEPRRERGKRGGECSRCGRGSRIREREICTVCNARYCGNCLLKAMGSMPEGRKCVSCIGQPIDEAKRASLGKLSKVLAKVCSPLEVKQIMRAERECVANQIRPEQLVVNGRQLRQEELGELLGCLNPPQKLKPGRYWYDKDSGLWGKEGEKPDRIISSKMNVGGKLRPEASNGNTKVYINGREVTKIELRVLKLAKVQCPQDTHFWVYDDGSYEEEGQNNIKGNIWAKAGIYSFHLFLVVTACTTG